MSFSTLYGYEETPFFSFQVKTLRVPVLKKFEHLPEEGAHNYLLKHRLSYTSELGGILLDWKIFEVGVEKFTLVIKGNFTTLRVSKGDTLPAKIVEIKNEVIVAKTLTTFLVYIENDDYKASVGDDIEFTFCGYNLEEDGLPVMQGKMTKLATDSSAKNSFAPPSMEEQKECQNQESNDVEFVQERRKEDMKYELICIDDDNNGDDDDMKIINKSAEDVAANVNYKAVEDYFVNPERKTLADLVNKSADSDMQDQSNELDIRKSKLKRRHEQEEGRFPCKKTTRLERRKKRYNTIERKEKNEQKKEVNQSDEKMFKCGIGSCTKSFKAEMGLKQHQKAVHHTKK
eukprot:TRINITY_DN6536_c0_g1_i10.p1 TRINITY_DN6536_c0_g1~~TRINITY_DN6536_c0_g1_i10.p1  ORF type:complete len:344 (-),score=76.49 TRINITY_DN6536_c0_g1_i10:491-1522(-)